MNTNLKEEKNPFYRHLRQDHFKQREEHVQRACLVPELDGGKISMAKQDRKGE